MLSEKEMEKVIKEEISNNNERSQLLKQQGEEDKSYIIDTLHTRPPLPTSSFVTLANKDCYGRSSMTIHAALTNGGEIPLNSRYSIAFVKNNKDHVSVQIRVYDEGGAPKKQTYVRTKKVIEKAPVKEKTTASVKFKTSEEKKSVW